MENWLIGLIILVGAFIVSLFFEEARDFYGEILEYISDALTYIISFEWLSDLGEVFSSAFEALTNIEDSPLTNIWFWAFYACLMLGVWYFPARFGLADYSFSEKILYTVIFFIVDWIIVSHIQNN